MASVVTSVRQCLVSRIASRAYPVGSIIPGCRLLAQELGVSKNTVTRAFRMLREHGLVRQVPGVGLLVVRVPGSAEQASIVDITSELSGLVRRARAVGMSRKQLEEACSGLIDRWYSESRLRFALVECNEWDARSLARDIESRFGVTVTPVLLDDFFAKPEAVLSHYDLVLTTFYHLAETPLDGSAGQSPKTA